MFLFISNKRPEKQKNPTKIDQKLGNCLASSQPQFSKGAINWGLFLRGKQLLNYENNKSTRRMCPSKVKTVKTFYLQNVHLTGFEANSCFYCILHFEKKNPHFF